MKLDAYLHSHPWIRAVAISTFLVVALGIVIAGGVNTTGLADANAGRVAAESQRDDLAEQIKVMRTEARAAREARDALTDEVRALRREVARLRDLLGGDGDAAAPDASDNAQRGPRDTDASTRDTREDRPDDGAQNGSERDGARRGDDRDPDDEPSEGGTPPPPPPDDQVCVPLTTVCIDSPIQDQVKGNP